MNPRTLPAPRPRGPIALTLAVLVLLTAGSAIQAAPTVDELVAKGQSLLAEGKAKKAAKQFRRAVEESEGEDLDALLGLAQASLRAGDSHDAVEASQKILATTRDPAARLTAYQVLGSGHYDLATRNRERPSRDVLDAAAEAYREAQALGRERGIHTPSYSLALVLSELDDLAAARDLLRSLPLDQLDPSLASRARQLLCQVKQKLPTEPLERESVEIGEDRMWRPRAITSLPGAVPGIGDRDWTRGTFSFRLFFDTEGCFHSAELLSALGPDKQPVEDRDFDLEPSLESFRKHVYEPARLEGVPVPFHVSLVVSFENR